MKISLEWLSEYVEIDRSAQEIADLLSDRGFPTEGIEQIDADTVIDVEITSNRGDCLSHIGIARELAAATGRQLRLPAVGQAASERDVSEFVRVRIEEPELCGRYTARVITGVKVGPTPEWMRKRLEAVGVRSVNNVVDATNYAMLEIGQPPHAFDYDKLRGGEIIVRKGRKGELLVTIDQTKAECDGRMLIIADLEGPVAMAGVMGGLETEIGEGTTTVLLEEAHFDPVSIRTTARKLTIPSEASFRFERHVDVEGIDYASQRCAELIVQVAGGEVVRGVADAYPGKRQAETVGMRYSRLKLLLGIEVPKKEVQRIFESLGLRPQEKSADLVVCTVPSWRHDLYREVDLIEEVARCYGYDKIPVEPKIHIEVAPVQWREQLAALTREVLTAGGYFETVNPGFLDDKTAGLFGDTGRAMRVADVTRKSANILRQSLLGSLLAVLRTNYNVGNSPCRIFELADTFKPSPDAALPNERAKLGLASDGDFQELRGVIEELVERALPGAKVEVKPADVMWADAGAQVLLDGEPFGEAGCVSKKTAQAMDLPDVEVVAAELDFQTMLERTPETITVKPLPRFPSIVRDLSLILDEAVTWDEILSSVNAKAPAELEEVRFVGIYRGKPIPKGKKSLTLSLRFRDDRGTLTHEEVDAFEKAIVAELESRLRAERRTA